MASPPNFKSLFAFHESGNQAAGGKFHWSETYVLPRPKFQVAGK
jgi:hypothetical protein